MGFLDPNTDFRFILPTETDANSPISEELMSQIRENMESNMMDTKYTGLRFEVVSVDSDTQMTVTKVDSGDDDWAAGQLSLLITSMQTGNALGFNYDIDNNTELNTGTSTITFTGTTLLSDGILAGDIGLIMYSFTGIAHTHDGKNSPAVSAEDNWYESTYNDTWTAPSTPAYPPALAPEYYSGPAAGRIYCKVRISGWPFSYGSDDLSGMQIRMVLYASENSFNYVDPVTGDYQSYSLSSDVTGPSLTVGTVPGGLTQLWMAMDKGLHSLDLVEAGVPSGAPFQPRLEFVAGPSLPFSASMSFSADIIWFTSP